MRKKNQPKSLEGFVISKGKIGDVFFSNRGDNHLQALATHYKRKILTNRLIAMDKKKLKNSNIEYLTKVEIIG